MNAWVNEDGRWFCGSKPSRASRSFRGWVSGLTAINVKVAFRFIWRVESREDIAAGAISSHEIGIIIVKSIARALGEGEKKEDRHRC